VFRGGLPQPHGNVINPNEESREEQLRHEERRDVFLRCRIRQVFVYEGTEEGAGRSRFRTVTLLTSDRAHPRIVATDAAATLSIQYASR